MHIIKNFFIIITILITESKSTQGPPEVIALPDLVVSKSSRLDQFKKTGNRTKALIENKIDYLITEEIRDLFNQSKKTILTIPIGYYIVTIFIGYFIHCSVSDNFKIITASIFLVGIIGNIIKEFKK